MGIWWCNSTQHCHIRQSLIEISLWPEKRSSINWSIRCSFSILLNVIEYAPLWPKKKGWNKSKDFDSIWYRFIICHCSKLPFHQRYFSFFSFILIDLKNEFELLQCETNKKKKIHKQKISNQQQHILDPHRGWVFGLLSFQCWICYELRKFSIEHFSRKIEWVSRKKLLEFECLSKLVN